MKKMRPITWSASIAGVAVVAGCLLTGSGMQSMSTSDASGAQLLSAAGNVVGKADVMQTVAVVYMESYPTREQCEDRVDWYLASDPQRYRVGGCSNVTSGPYRGYHQVWLDDNSFCYDRVAPTEETVLAAPAVARLAV